jgi:LEA14-like dessication related protein
MNKNFLIGITAVAAAGYYFLKGKKQVIENLEIKPIDIAINKSKTNLFKAVFNLKLKLTNPGNFAVKVKNIDVDVIVNNNVISQFQKNLPVTIAPKATEIILIEITVQNLAVVEAILTILNDSSNISAGVVGTVTTDLGVAKINFIKNL